MQRNDAGTQDEFLTLYWFNQRFGFGVGQERDLGTDAMVGKGSFNYVYSNVHLLSHRTVQSFHRTFIHPTMDTFRFQLPITSPIHLYVHIHLL
jgi:hypothetical protein